MKSGKCLKRGLPFVVLASWSSGASAFEVTLWGAMERSSSSSRLEVFAALVLPLDEWTQVTPEVARWTRRNPSSARAWDYAQRGEEAAVREGAELAWAIEPTWATGAPWGIEPLGSSEPLGLSEPLGSSEPLGLSEPLGTFEPPELSEPARRGTFELTQAPEGKSPEPLRESAHEAAGPARSTAKPMATRVRPPRLEKRFIQALMKACSEEFRGARSQLVDLADRARWSAWLPELQVKGGRNTDQTLRLTPTEAEPDRYQLVGDDGVRFEGQMRWTFSQLVFARDELAVARLRGALEVEQRKRQQQAMGALSKWLAAWAVLASAPSEEGALLDAWVSESSHRAELDWLSHGWFSAHVPAPPEWSDLGVP